MKGCSEAQALIRGERGFPCVAGCVRVSPLRCGSMVQIHIHGLPCSVSRFGFSISRHIRSLRSLRLHGGLRLFPASRQTGLLSA